MRYAYSPVRQKFFLSAYLNWLCHVYNTSRPKLYLYNKVPLWWHSYNERYEGRVAGFYSFKDCNEFGKEIHILICRLDLDKAVERLRHEWRHHWQYIYHRRLLEWWGQHESLYKLLHDQAKCAIEMDARNFAIHFQWHQPMCDEQLLAEFTEDELLNIENVLVKRKFAQRASAICNVASDSQICKKVWVPETPAYNRYYRSGWKGKKRQVSVNAANEYTLRRIAVKD